MKTILITGSSGLIGKVLCKKLKDSLYKIKRFDVNLPTEHPEYGDILCHQTIQERLEKCDGVVHLAAVSRVIWGEQQPDLCWQTNVTGTRHVLESAYTSSNQPWVLYASSREVYGQQKRFPVTESAPLQPLNTYARSKVAAEELVAQYQSRGLKAAILRFSSVYGRIDDHYNRVVPAFCHAAAWGKPLRIEGIENTFDFAHLPDVVDGILETIKHLEQGHPLPPVHLTSGQPVALGALAKLACQFSEKQSQFITVPSRSFDVSTFYGDTRLANKLLGWAPKIDIKTGVSQLVNDFLKKQ